jgi:hypothetical protein
VSPAAFHGNIPVDFSVANAVSIIRSKWPVLSADMRSLVVRRERLLSEQYSGSSYHVERTYSFHNFRNVFALTRRTCRQATYRIAGASLSAYLTKEVDRGPTAS